MVKVFPDTPLPRSGLQVLRFGCASNEYEPGQFAIRSNTGLEGVSVILSDLISKKGNKIPFRELNWNFQGFVHSPDKGSKSMCGVHDDVPEGELTRKLPCDIPNPLLESRVEKLKEKLGPAAELIPSDFRSKEICGMIVKGLADHEEDPEVIYSVKKLIASEIAEIDRSPLILFTSVPDINTPVMIGPGEVKIYGVAEKQARVKINGKKINLKSDGSFMEMVRFGSNESSIEIELEKEGKKKTIVREFELK